MYNYKVVFSRLGVGGIVMRQYNFFIVALLSLWIGSISSTKAASAVGSIEVPGLVPGKGVSFAEGDGTNTDQSSTEKKVVHGHRSLPPGYQDAPSMDFQYGDDPDHLAKVHRDPVTGADLSRFGSAYQSSSPFGSGTWGSFGSGGLGSSTGNGWIIPAAPSL